MENLDPLGVHTGESIVIAPSQTLNNKEYFVAQCSYVPWGPSFDFCVSNCKSKSRIGLWDSTGNFCNEDICREKDGCHQRR